MNVFATNQVNQVYVAKAKKDTVANLTDVGDILVKATPDKSAIYFQHKGAGGITRSDLIEVKNIMYAKATSADAMARKLKKYTVTLDSTINGGQVIEGVDYILRMEFDNYIGYSPEDSKYWKFGAVHGYANMTVSDFYKTLAISIAKNMSREAFKLLKVELSDGTEVTKHTKESTLSGSYTSVVLKEVEPDWVLGTKHQKPLTFRVFSGTIVTTPGAPEREWGSIEKGTDGVVTNGKAMADLEYFLMGERGDVYRKINFPDYVPTTYLVDPTKEYDTINIHYSYVGSNESVQKSEKDLTLIVPKGGTSDLITAINELITASGIKIEAI